MQAVSKSGAEQKANEISKQGSQMPSHFHNSDAESGGLLENRHWVWSMVLPPPTSEPPQSVSLLPAQSSTESLTTQLRQHLHTCSD